MKKALFCLLFSVIFLFALSAEQRTALVIGNSNYKTSPLRNPANDARDMATALEELGFSVTSLIRFGGLFCCGAHFRGVFYTTCPQKVALRPFSEEFCRTVAVESANMLESGFGKAY